MEKRTLYAEGSFKKGNLHTHSTRSDGKYTPAEIAEHYRSKGYDFLAITALVFALAGVYAHFLFNGNVYFYIWNSRNRQRKRQTKERQNKEEQEGMKA